MVDLENGGGMKIIPISAPSEIPLFLPTRRVVAESLDAALALLRAHHPGYAADTVYVCGNVYCFVEER